MSLRVKNWPQNELPLGNRQPWGPQRPEKWFSHNPTNHGEGYQDKAKTAKEYNAILTGHAPSHVLDWNQVKRILVVDCGDNTAQV